MNSFPSRLIAVAIAAFVAYPAVHAQEALEEPPTIITIEPIIVEGEPIRDTLSPEEIRKKFDEVLGDKSKEVISERWVSNDTVMIRTRSSRYCVKFVPQHLRSSLDNVSGFAGACMGF